MAHHQLLLLSVHFASYLQNSPLVFSKALNFSTSSFNFLVESAWSVMKARKLVGVKGDSSGSSLFQARTYSFFCDQSFKAFTVALNSCWSATEEHLLSSFMAVACNFSCAFLASWRVVIISLVKPTSSTALFCPELDDGAPPPVPPSHSYWSPKLQERVLKALLSAWYWEPSSLTSLAPILVVSCLAFSTPAFVFLQPQKGTPSCCHC